MPSPTDESAVESDVSRAIAALIASRVLAVCVVQGDRVVHANAGFAHLFDLDSADSAPGGSFSRFPVPAERGAVAEHLRLASTDGKAFVFMFHAETSRGKQLFIDVRGVALAQHDVVTHALVLTDVTERRRSEAVLTYMAFADPLTGLANRARFFDLQRECFVAASRGGQRFGIILGDLDGFKAVNDADGHEAGDALLSLVGVRIRECTRESDTIARLGGDEFAVLLPGVAQPEDASMVAQRILRAFETPFDVAGHRHPVGISLGLAVYPDHCKNPEDLFAAADAAMYASKNAGKRRYTVAQASFESHARTRVDLVPWSEAHAVGIAEVDDQHRQIVDRVNRLASDIQSGKTQELLVKSLGAILTATREHFAYEEQRMSTAGVRSLEAHRRKHRELLDELASLGVHMDERSMMLTIRHLHEWLFRHIDTLDRLMAKELLS